MNEFQRVIAESYEGGELNHGDVLGDLDTCGDGLFKFLMIEMSDSEDCDGFITAIGRLTTIAGQINEVKEAMIKRRGA